MIKIKGFRKGNARPFNTKRRAKKSAKLHRQRGYKARIIKTKKGYNIWIKRGRK